MLAYHLGEIWMNFTMLTLYFYNISSDGSLYSPDFLLLLLCLLLLHFSIPSWWDKDEFYHVEGDFLKLNWMQAHIATGADASLTQQTISQSIKLH
jgi:hypothetical protein